MGFKKVDLDELKTKMSTNFLGIPIRDGGKIVEKSFREKKIESSYKGLFSEILILNEEFLEFNYTNNGKRESALGNGTISIFNNSVKDRIWDAKLQFSGSQFNDQDDDNNLELGIFEPNSNKVLKYEILSSDELPDLLKVNEKIENQTEEDIDSFTKAGGESILKENKLNNYVLLLDRENFIKFSITLENVSSSMLEKIKFKKNFPSNFYDLEFKSEKSKDFKITRNSIECPLNTLNPGEKADVTITAKVFPKKKEDIKTGKLELTFNLSNKVISGVKINQFSGYSHAMHAIKKAEKNYAPNNWQCSLIFENHSDFKMLLKSILIFDKSKSKKILDLDFSSSGNTIVLPRGKYTSEYFDIVDEKEPTFSRKIEYSVHYKSEGNSMITSKFDESNFKIASVLIKKKLAEGEIKSFEQTTVNSRIIISNQGTLPVKGLKITEMIPEDFLPPRDITKYKLYRSSGVIDLEDMELKIIPDDDDSTHEHMIELSINLRTDRLKSVIELEDFLELKYPLKAITPDYKKAYDFPLKVYSYYPKYIDSFQNEFYVITDDLSKMDKSAIKISHRRRKLMVGKEIFPGRSSNEFAIYIVAKNGSNIKLNEVSVADTFPDCFELISSNLDHNLTKSKKNGEYKISFLIDTILPYQEREIMYYLKNISSKDVKHSELESFFVG